MYLSHVSDEYYDNEKMIRDYKIAETLSQSPLKK